MHMCVCVFKYVCRCICIFLGFAAILRGPWRSCVNCHPGNRSPWFASFLRGLKKNKSLLVWQSMVRLQQLQRTNERLQLRKAFILELVKDNKNACILRYITGKTKQSLRITGLERERQKNFDTGLVLSSLF